MRQFFLETEAASPPPVGGTVVLDREESHHLETVLRGGRDEVLHLTDGRGRRYTACSRGRSGKLARLEILTVGEDVAEMRRPHLVLACAVVKGRRFEWVLEKAVELGAHRLVPLLCEHGVILPRDGKQDRWRSLLIAAVKQSGRSWLPELTPPAPLAGVLAAAGGAPVLFGAVPDELDGTVAADLSSLLAGPPPAGAAELTLLIGPEGGWTAAERDRLLAGGARPLRLGPHVLRTETAAVAGLGALQAWREAAREP